MNSNRKISDLIETWAGDSIVDTSSLAGGCIAQTTKLKMKSGRTYFLKTGNSASAMYRKEANGLKELRKADAIRIPGVLLVEDSFLLLEYIEPGRAGRTFFEKFGRQFAQMHRFNGKQFGFHEDNFIGSTDQKNIPSANEADNWCQFYFNKRLLFQFRLAEKKGYATEKMRKGFANLENKMEKILHHSEEAPSLLHGDLWSGNFLVDSNGEACLIDPAVYYGHREADLAMTKLFGGFSGDFYRAYQESFPLPAGHEYRENIYLLYHVMNHLNLFGNSYYNQAIQLLYSYL